MVHIHKNVDGSYHICITYEAEGISYCFEGDFSMLEPAERQAEDGGFVLNLKICE